MDKKLKVFLALFLCLGQMALAQSYMAGLNKQANQMITCFKAGNYGCLLDYTHPKIVKSMGGAKTAEKTLSDGIGKMKAQGAEISKVTLQPVKQHLISGKTIQCIIPQLVEVKYQGQSIKSKTYLFGITYNNGKNWYFVDTGSQTEEKMRQFMPEMSKKILIPKAERSFN